MSEYIIKLADNDAPMMTTAEEIVRCRDCKHNVNGACARWDYCDIDGSNGFCAWAKRKEGGE